MVKKIIIASFISAFFSASTVLFANENDHEKSEFSYDLLTPEELKEMQKLLDSWRFDNEEEIIRKKSEDIFLFGCIDENGNITEEAMDHILELLEEERTKEPVKKLSPPKTGTKCLDRTLLEDRGRKNWPQLR